MNIEVTITTKISTLTKLFKAKHFRFFIKSFFKHLNELKKFYCLIFNFFEKNSQNIITENSIMIINEAKFDIRTPSYFSGARTLG